METCVLVHGFGGSPEEIEPLAVHLRAAGYHVIVPVLTGHCASKEDMRRATTSSWVQCVHAVVEPAVAQGPVHLIGFSMGAMISAIISTRLSVQSLTMLAPAVYYTSLQLVFKQMAKVIKKGWETANNGGMRAVYERIDAVAQTPLESIRQFRRMVQMATTHLPQVTTPTCIVHGELDDVIESRSSDFIYNQIAATDKQVHYLPGSGHMVCLGVEGGVVNDIVLAFLSHHRVENANTTTMENS